VCIAVSPRKGEKVLITPSKNLTSQPLVSGQRNVTELLDLETLFFVRSIRSLRWSVDGESLYFDTNVTGRFNIWQVPAEGGWPVQLTVSDERTLLEDPSPDGRFLLYKQDQGGDEKPNLFLLDPKGGRAHNITNTKQVGYGDIQWSLKGEALAVTAEREAPGAYSLYLIDPESWGVEKIAGNERGECLQPRWSPVGHKIALTRTRDYVHAGVCVLDLDTRTEHELVPIDEQTTTVAMGWTRDGKRLLVNSNANEAGVDAVATLGVENAAYEWLTLADWESYLSDTSPVEDYFIYVRNEAGNHRVFLRKLVGREVEISLPAGVLSMARFSPDSRRVAILHASADSPKEIWVYELSTGMMKKISHSLVGWLKKEDFVRPQLVVYPSFDDTPISAFAYLPPNIKPDQSHPAIVYPHGGPTWQHMNGWFPHLQYLVSHGFLVIAPNFRGSTGFGRDFMEANKKDLGGGDLRDVVASVEFLRRSGYADAHRIAFMGASYGGYLTLMALTKFPEIWAAGVAIVPFANFFTSYKNEDPVLQAYDRALMGDPVKDFELWHDRSPIFFVDRIRAPLLLLAGANDIRCPAEETEQTVEAIRQRGGIVEAKIYESEGHGFARRENEIDAFKRAVTFLQAYLM
jgi:dipeptidyl aminopeptidase/acylaminoacyl peptidase